MRKRFTNNAWNTISTLLTLSSYFLKKCSALCAWISIFMDFFPTWRNEQCSAIAVLGRNLYRNICKNRFMKVHYLEWECEQHTREYRPLPGGKVQALKRMEVWFVTDSKGLYGGAAVLAQAAKKQEGGPILWLERSGSRNDHLQVSHYNAGTELIVIDAGTRLRNCAQLRR